MSEAGINTEDLVPGQAVTEGKRARLMRWFKEKVGRGQKAELKAGTPLQTIEAPPPIAGGETDNEPETQEGQGKWETDTTRRLNRAEQAEPVRDTEGLTKRDKLNLLTGQGGPPNELESLNRNDELIALAAEGVARQKQKIEKPGKPTLSQKPVRPLVRRTA